MKKEQRKTSDLKQFFGIKEPSDRGGKKKPILKKTHFTIWYFVIAFLIILLIQNYFVMKKTEDVISYSEFKEALRANKIKDITITPETITGERETEKGPRKFQTVRVEDSDLVKELEALPDFKKEVSGGEGFLTAEALEEAGEYLEAINTIRDKAGRVHR